MPDRLFDIYDMYINDTVISAFFVLPVQFNGSLLDLFSCWHAGQFLIVVKNNICFRRPRRLAFQQFVFGQLE